MRLSQLGCGHRACGKWYTAVLSKVKKKNLGRPTDHPREIAGWSAQHLGGPYMMWSEMTMEPKYRNVSFIFNQ